MISNVYTNPPCNDRVSYHKMTEKYIRQVDTSIKLCYKCDSKAVIVEDKKYYCASCALQKLPRDKIVLRKKR